MSGKEFTAKIVVNKELNCAYRRLSLSFYCRGFICRPGQFVMLKPLHSAAPLLRRPFSIWDWQSHGPWQRLELFYKVVGEGTRALANLAAGVKASLAAPLGNGFVSDPDRPFKLLISGGVGLPPIDFLLRRILAEESRAIIHLFHGERQGRQHLRLDWEKKHKRAFIHRASEDGRRGFHGQSVELLKQWLTEVQKQGLCRSLACQVFACGPNPMLKALFPFCREREIPLQISVENHMGCGRGVCLGCVIKKQGGDQPWARVCTEGPVFNGGEVELP